MKKFLKLFLSVLFVFSMTQACFAEDYKVLVLPDNLQFESTNYYIYPGASVMFASDIINCLNIDGSIKTVSMNEIRDTFRKNVGLKILAQNTLKEFKYNYNIAFVDLKKIAHGFSTDKVLIITSTTDVQNYFLRRTIWDILNIAGATVIDPAYKMSTYVALVDVDKEQVIWQRTYQKMIGTPENRILAISFAPASEQLDVAKSYSDILSSEIAHIIKSKILPPVTTSVEGSVISTDSKEVEIKTPPSCVKSVIETEIKTKSFAPTRPRSRNNGAMVNDL